MGYKKKSVVELLNVDTETVLSIPFVKEGIVAGFPSPAQDFIDGAIDLNKELIKHPSATFYGRVKGNSMQDAGIHDGDVLVIDKSLQLKDGDIAICFIDGEFTVKYVKLAKGKKEIFLMPANQEFEPIRITEENNFIVWGIVTYVIKKMR